MSENSEVLRTIVLSHSAAVFIKSDVQRPMQLVLNAPMRAYRLQNPFGTANTGDMIAIFAALLFTNLTLCSDPANICAPNEEGESPCFAVELQAVYRGGSLFRSPPTAVHSGDRLGLLACP